MASRTAPGPLESEPAAAAPADLVGPGKPAGAAVPAVSGVSRVPGGARIGGIEPGSGVGAVGSGGVDGTTGVVPDAVGSGGVEAVGGIGLSRRTDLPAGPGGTGGGLRAVPAGLPSAIGHEASPSSPVGPDDVAVALSGLPPEVAAFLVASAAAAGVELGPALRDAGVRVRRRRSRTSPDRVQRSFYLSRDLVDRARAAVTATMLRPGEAYNVSQLAGRGLENEVLRLERTYNGGERFPAVNHVPSGPSPEGVERIRAGVTTPRRRRDGA